MSDSIWHGFGERVQRRVVIDDSENLEEIAVGVARLTGRSRLILDHVAAARGRRHGECDPVLVTGD